MTLLLDTNVLLDVLADRAPWAEHSAQVLGHVERGAITGYVAAHGVTTLYYLLATHRDRNTARQKTRLLLRLLEVAAVDEDRLLQALDLPMSDYEDAVQVACAEKVGADVIVTRDPDDFEGTDPAVRSPTELLARLGDAP